MGTIVLAIRITYVGQLVGQPGHVWLCTLKVRYIVSAL